ncbi:MAG: exosortase/archaeosortase family protein [Planctomycetota bacterium]
MSAEEQKRTEGILSKRRNTAAVVFAALSLLCVFSGWSIWRELLGLIRHDPELNYLVAVPVLIVLLALTRRRRMGREAPIGRWAGVAVLVLALTLRQASNSPATPQWVWFGSGPLLFLGIFIAVWGLGVLKNWAPALFLLILLVPVPTEIRYSISVPLEGLTALIAGASLSAVGVEVERFGSLLTVNGVPVNVAEACGGTRMVMAVGLAVYAYVFLNPLTTGLRIGVLLLMPAIALLCNVLRVVASVAVYATAEESTAQAFHDMSAWGLMILAYLLCLGLIKLWGWLGFTTEFEPADTTADIQTAGPDSADHLSRSPRRHWAPVVFAGLLLCISAWTQYRPEVTGEVSAYRAEVKKLTNAMAGPGEAWTSADHAIPAAAINLLRPNVVVQRRYTHRTTGESFDFALVHCGQVRDLRMHHPPQCYGNIGWQVSSPDEKKWEAGGMTVEGNEYSVRRMVRAGAQQLQVNNTFLLPGRGSTREHDEMLILERDRARNMMGAAELQWVFDPRIPRARRDEIITAFLLANKKVIELLSEGPR